MKRCTRCGIEKPLSAFQADSRRRDGRKARCKRCVSRKPAENIDLRGWLGLPEEASLTVEVSLPYGMNPAPYVMALVARDAGARWQWHHVEANGDYWCLDLSVKIDDASVKARYLSHWTREQARHFESALRNARGAETESFRLPPAPMSYAASLSLSKASVT